MEAFLALFLFSFIGHLNCFTAQTPYSSIVLPVTKDASTLQYTTQIFVGNPSISTKFVLDLGGSLMWAHCNSNSKSSSQSYIQSRSLSCSMAKSSDSYTRSTEVNVKVNSNKACEIYSENSITGMSTSGYLAEDIISFDYQDRLKIDAITTVDQAVLYSCTSSLLLKGLASGTKGMLGLGRSKLALTSQLSNSLDLRRKFAVCLSSSDGVIFTGGGGPFEMSKSLVYTPLVSVQDDLSTDYYVNVKSIKINGKKLSLGKSFIGEAKLSTVVPYTTLESTIYGTIIKAYEKSAVSMNLSRVAAVAPFGLCFSSKGVEKTKMGPVVPIIDLVLRSELVKWRVYGRNSMVQVNEAVMCLGLLDGGLSPKNLIVIGGYQLEDNLLEFNLGTSMLGFSSILIESTGCSSFRPGRISSGVI